MASDGRRLNSCSDSASSSISLSKSLVHGDINCFCNKPAKLFQSWTNENPGRRFYGCGSFKIGQKWCKFFRWHDVEKVSGWAKDALVESRKQLRAKDDEIKELSRIITRLEDDRKNIQAGKGTEFGLELKAIEFDVASLRQELKRLELDNDKLKQKLLKKKTMAVELQKKIEIYHLSLACLCLMFAIVVVSYYLIAK